MKNTGQGAIPLTNAQDVKAVHDAQGTLDNARKTFERRKTLFDQGGISKKDLEASQLDVTKAEDDLRLAERAASLHQGTTNPSDLATARSKAQQAAGHLASLTAQAGYATIRAPFDGVIGDQFLYQGDFANAGTKMLTIADTSTVIVKAPLSVDAAMHVRAGDSATIQPDSMPGVTLQGTVSLVGRAADPQSRTVELWITLPNPDGRLRPNSAARVTIKAPTSPNAIVVPTAAVTLDATNANSGTVMVVDAKSVAHEVNVTIGAHSRERTQITSGLAGRRDRRHRRQLRSARRHEGSERGCRAEAGPGGKGLMNLGRVVANQKRAVLLVIALLSLGGLIALARIPRALFPQTDFPRIIIVAENGVAPAQQTLVSVTGRSKRR